MVPWGAHSGLMMIVCSWEDLCLIYVIPLPPGDQGCQICIKSWQIDTRGVQFGIFKKSDYSFKLGEPNCIEKWSKIVPNLSRSAII